MGLSIHYSGTISDLSSIPQLVSETVDICENMGWKYDLLNKPNRDSFEGIIFSPEGCEPVFLTFLPTGQMCSPINLMNKDIYEEHGLEPDIVFTTSTKTQYAGPDAHMAIIKLLLHLKEKYFSAFEMKDEGNYWETGDEKILLEHFQLYDRALEMVGAALEGMTQIPGESPGALAERIAKQLESLPEGPTVKIFTSSKSGE